MVINVYICTGGCFWSWLTIVRKWYTSWLCQHLLWLALNFTTSTKSKYSTSFAYTSKSFFKKNAIPFIQVFNLVFASLFFKNLVNSSILVLNMVSFLSCSLFIPRTGDSSKILITIFNIKLVMVFIIIIIFYCYPCVYYIAPDMVNRQAVLCHRVLRMIQTLVLESSILDEETWYIFLVHMLCFNTDMTNIIKANLFQ